MNQKPMRYRPVNRSNAEERNKRLEQIKYVKLIVVVQLALLALVYMFLLTSTLACDNNQKPTGDPSLSGSPSDSSSSSELNSGSDSESSSNISPDGIVYTHVEKPFADTQKGILVLIDNDHHYAFTDTLGFIDIRDNRPVNAANMKLYQMNAWTMHLRTDAFSAMNELITKHYANAEGQDILLAYAYRSFDEQKLLYEANPNSAAAPGASDYHSGYSFALQPLNGKTDTFNAMLQDLHEYGIIQRYPASKADITGINYDLNHYRFVGIPHAYIMNEYDYCLEQYLDYVKGHPFDGEHIKFSTDSSDAYEIYYVAASTEGMTRVPVPQNEEYTISGDNMGGFIVCVKTK